MLLSAPADLSPAKMVQYIKGAIVAKIAGRIPRTKEEVLGSASVVTRILLRAVGAVDESTIREYVENQKGDEDDQGFKIAAPAEP
jgi:putative transposase